MSTYDGFSSCAALVTAFAVPGEHDVLSDNGEQYRNRFAKGTTGSGWYSFTHQGVHFVGWREIDFTCKPGFNGMLVTGFNIYEMRANKSLFPETTKLAQRIEGIFLTVDR